jgi:hypothetical protein
MFARWSIIGLAPTLGRAVNVRDFKADEAANRVGQRKEAGGATPGSSV